MKCRWYAERYNGKCFNGSCPYRGDTCPTSEYPEACRYAEAKQEPELNAEELATALRNCASEEGECKNCPYLHLHLFESGICCDDCLKRKAADMLEKLAAERDAKKPEWISVKDRLPEKNRIVLVCMDNGQYKAVLTSYLSSSDGEWISYDKNRKVTHWMPFPEPPKEEER